MATKSYCVTLLVTGYYTFHVEAEIKVAASETAKELPFNIRNRQIDNTEVTVWEVDED